MASRTTQTISRGPRHARAIALRAESDAQLVVRRAQDAFVPLLIVALAWVLATSATLAR